MLARERGGRGQWLTLVDETADESRYSGSRSKEEKARCYNSVRLLGKRIVAWTVENWEAAFGTARQKPL
jgi:hypothetical protein